MQSHLFVPAHVNRLLQQFQSLRKSLLNLLQVLLLLIVLVNPIALVALFNLAEHLLSEVDVVHLVKLLLHHQPLKDYLDLHHCVLHSVRLHLLEHVADECSVES